jgi:hypothetical protein
MRPESSNRFRDRAWKKRLDTVAAVWIVCAPLLTLAAVGFGLRPDAAPASARHGREAPRSGTCCPDSGRQAGTQGAYTEAEDTGQRRDSDRTSRISSSSLSA